MALLAMAGVLVLGGQRAQRATADSIIYVDAAAGGANNGTSWADAYTDLQLALAGARDGDQVWVAAGVYKPGAARTDSFVMKTGVAIYGGFGGGETSIAQRDVAGKPTILSGDLAVLGEATDNSYQVVAGGSVGPTAVLNGFVIRGGYANGPSPAFYGGGLYITSGSPTLANLTFTTNFAFNGGGLYNDSGGPTLTNVTFTANTASTDGGGLKNKAGSPVLTNVTFSANAARFGGGMENDTGSPALTNVTFAGNAARYGGGGFYNSSGDPRLTGVTFSSNAAEFGGGSELYVGSPRLNDVTFFANVARLGGGLYIDYGDTTLTNVTFSTNSAASGGGMYNSDETSPVLTNVTFVHNRASAEGGGIENIDGSLTVKESILWGNTPDQFYEEPGAPGATIEHNIIEGGCPATTNCTPADIIMSDPLLADLGNNGGLTKTQALKTGSPAIDAGTPAICATVPTDQRGVARPVDGNKDGTAECDLGAFEYVPPAPTVGFAAATASGSESVTTVNIPVKLSTTAIGTVTVKYKIANGTATSPSDYIAATGTLRFPALTTTKRLTFAVVNDRFDEPNETVVITLSAPTGASLGTATHVYTILDDDPRVTCRGRLPTIVGTAGNDTLVGTKGIDVIVGLVGSDIISGNGGDDVICGGPGNDTISGGNGNDVVRGDAGNDKLTGDRGSDLLSGGGGKDQLGGGASPGDFCDGGPGVDALLPNHGCESQSGVP